MVQRLYELGARRVLVTGTGPLGCVPAELAQHSVNGECAAPLQQASALFNPQLVELLTQLNSEVGDHVFIAANTNEMNLDFINNPQQYGTDSLMFHLWLSRDLLSAHERFTISVCLAGFITSKIACCGQGRYNGIGLCTRLSNLCENRDLYAFWDPFHPSEKANKLIVQQMMIGPQKYMHPMNLSMIIAMDSRV